jgi:hypothetical protein
MLVGIFHSCLGLANATKTAECGPATIDQRLLELRQQIFPAGKERIAIRNFRKRHFSARRATLIFWRRAY